MLLCALQLLLPAESAHDTIYALGEVGMLQFKDLNSDKNAFQRTYANQVGQVSDIDTGCACCDKRLRAVTATQWCASAC